MPDTKPSVNSSTRLPRQQKGGPVLMANREIANLILSVIEQLLNLKVIQPTTDGKSILQAIDAQISRGELGMIITMPPAGANSSSGVNIADYDFDETVQAGWIRRVSPTSAFAVAIVPGVYFAKQSSEGILPIHPLQAAENEFWGWLSTWPKTLTACDSGGNVISLFADAQKPN